MSTAINKEIQPASIIICDDIRHEPSGKEMLIGVYSGVILFPSLPAMMPNFSTRIEFKTDLKQIEDMTVELHDEDGDVLFTVTGGMEMIGKDGVQVLSLVCHNVEFKKEGAYSLHFGRKASIEPVYRFYVRIDTL